MKVTEEMIDDAVGTFGGQGTKVITRGTIRHALVMALANIPEPVPGPFVLAEYEQWHVGALRAVMAENVAGGSIEVVLNALDRVERTLAAPAQAGGEWTRVDLMTAYEAAECSANSDIANNVRAALFALEHRLAAGAAFIAARDSEIATLREAVLRESERADKAEAAVEPLSDELRQDAEYTLLQEGMSNMQSPCRVAKELLRRCPKPAPKKRTVAELISFLRQEVSGRAGVSQALDQLSELLAKKGEK